MIQFLNSYFCFELIFSAFVPSTDLVGLSTQMNEEITLTSSAAQNSHFATTPNSSLTSVQANNKNPSYIMTSSESLVMTTASQLSENPLSEENQTNDDTTKTSDSIYVANFSTSGHLANLHTTHLSSLTGLELTGASQVTLHPSILSTSESLEMTTDSLISVNPYEEVNQTHDDYTMMSDTEINISTSGHLVDSHTITLSSLTGSELTDFSQVTLYSSKFSNTDDASFESTTNSYPYQSATTFTMKPQTAGYVKSSPNELLMFSTIISTIKTISPATGTRTTLSDSTSTPTTKKSVTNIKAATTNSPATSPSTKPSTTTNAITSATTTTTTTTPNSGEKTSSKISRNGTLATIFYSNATTSRFNDSVPWGPDNESVTINSRTLLTCVMQSTIITVILIMLC